MLERFYCLREEVKQFMEMRGTPSVELSDDHWLYDLVFMWEHLSELNIKLQGSNQLPSSLLLHVKTFEGKLRLWQNRLESGNTVHFPYPQKQNPAVTSEYVGECAKLIQAFDERFHDVEMKQKEVNMFPPTSNFYKLYVSVEDFPNMGKHALKFVSLFGTTYRCEHFFSELTGKKVASAQDLLTPIWKISCEWHQHAFQQTSDT